MIPAEQCITDETRIIASYIGVTEDCLTRRLLIWAICRQILTLKWKIEYAIIAFHAFHSQKTLTNHKKLDKVVRFGMSTLTFDEHLCYHPHTCGFTTLIILAKCGHLEIQNHWS